MIILSRISFSGISFGVSRLDETASQLPGGGYEIGTRPRLNLKWAMPQQFSEASNSFIDANQVTGEMNTRLTGIYGAGSGVSALDFLISVSKDESNPNNGTSVKITQQGSNYTAGANFDSVSVSSDVYGTDTPGSSGYLNFNLVGRMDTSITDPNEIPRQSSYDLQHLDIMPGTLYYLYLRPQFRGNADALRTASEYERNGYPITGSTGYVYTYIRFQLSRDEADNVYVSVFRLNRGSTNLPGMYYSIQINNSDSNVESAWTEVRRLRDSNFSNDRAMTNITGISPNNEMKYRIVVLTDDPDDLITSQRMAYTLSADVSKPPVPKGIAIDEMNLVNGTVNGVATKSSEAVISWEKPANWPD
jgi:hypothetical protein